jgi:hypothetical protein
MNKMLSARTGVKKEGENLNVNVRKSGSTLEP